MNFLVQEMIETEVSKPSALIQIHISIHICVCVFIDIPITPGVDVTIPNRKTTTSTSCALKKSSWHVSILMTIFTLSCFYQFRYLELCD